MTTEKSGNHVEFTHEGTTYRIASEKAMNAKVLLLPTGALVGLRMTETLPPQVTWVTEFRGGEMDGEEWTVVEDDEVVGG